MYIREIKYFFCAHHSAEPATQHKEQNKFVPSRNDIPHPQLKNQQATPAQNEITNRAQIRQTAARDRVLRWAHISASQPASTADGIPQQPQRSRYGAANGDYGDYFEPAHFFVLSL